MQQLINLLENWTALEHAAGCWIDHRLEALEGFRVLTDVNIKTLQANISGKNRQPWSPFLKDKKVRPFFHFFGKQKFLSLCKM